MCEPTLKKLSNPTEIAQSFFDLNLTREGLSANLPIVDIHYIEIRNLRFVQASLIEKEICDAGGGIAFDKAQSQSPESVDIILFARINQYQQLFTKLAQLPFGLARIAEDIRQEFIPKRSEPQWTFKDTSMHFSSIPKIMGILNITPDSFSDGGKYVNLESAITHSEKLIDDGADIIDIGGQSTRPGSLQVAPKDELERVIPIIKEIRKSSNIPISIDTYYSSVANTALEAGADIVNDVSACTKSPDMPEVVASHNAGLILMHMQGSQTDMQNNPFYQDVVKEISEYLQDRLNYCTSKGVCESNIVLDPGIGFGKTLENNLEIIRRLNEFRIQQRPVLLGHSRKSFIGSLTGSLVQDRDFESIIISALVAERNSADIIRVHEVQQTRNALSLLEKLSRSNM